MTRVHTTHRSLVGAHRSSAIDRTKSQRKKKPYKVVLESVTQEKKALHTTFSYTADAPPGYSFVPAGHPDLTEYCKDICRKRNLDVHIVSAKPKNRAIFEPDKISHHVHRIGHHFPDDVVAEACDALGYYVRNGVYHKNTRTLDDTRLARSLADYGQRFRLHGRPITDGETKDQIRRAVRDLFPKIPVWDLEAIVNHAFEEGTDRVGNAKGVPLARRVQLAVVAHIRHNYTDYDKLLKVGSWHDARALVEPVSLAKLKEWRDENDTDEVEETFREVIVLDDDEDVDESDDTLSGSDERASSMEIVSSRTAARELQADDPVYLPRVDSRYAGRAPGRLIRLPATLSSSIYPSFPYPVDQISRAHARPLPLVQERRRDLPYNYPAGPAEPPSRTTGFDSMSRTEPIRQWRDENGRLHNLLPVEAAHEIQTPVRMADSAAVQYHLTPGRAPLHVRESHIQAPQRVNSLNSDPYKSSAPVSRRTSEQDLVLPSVERDLEQLPSPRRHPDVAYQPRHGYSSPSISYTGPAQEMLSPKRKAFHTSVHDVEDRHYEQISKRTQAAYRSDENGVTFSSPYASSSRQVDGLEMVDNRSRPRVQPIQDVIDISSSPYRSSDSRGRAQQEYVAPSRSYASNSSQYVPAPTRASPPRERRDPYVDRFGRELRQPLGVEPPPVDERALPRSREYVMVRDQAPHPSAPHDARYPRAALLHR